LSNPPDVAHGIALRTAIAALDRLYDVLPRTDDLPIRVAVLAVELRERVREVPQGAEVRAR